MIRPNKVFIFFLAIIFFISGNAAGYAYVLVSEYLCELGIQYYQQGKLADAIQEFNKALIANPDNETAKKYIDLIRGEANLSVTLPPIFAKPPVKQIPAKKISKAKISSPESRSRLISEILDKLERGIPQIPPQQVALPEILTLDDTLKTLQFPLEIEQRQNIIIRGRNIARFLSTQLDILNIERSSPNEIVVTGNKFGYTDLYIWDDQGRWILEFLSKPAKPEFPTLGEQMRLEEEKAGTFKLRYYLDWSSREQGRRIDSLKRLSYGYTHGLNIYGQTPYGDLNSSLT
ncbi:MAG: pilus assembly protein N-terminal domain-containing protein, partial [Candidatus Omnitrophica bacterium]|nr:pilus assembly protein N-terminal domain-containing protein [Candidatus Omnitrophota bacterium]